MTLPGAHRVIKRNGTGTHIKWYAWRGKGAPLIAKFDGTDDKAALAAEARGAPAIAEKWAKAAYPRASGSTMAGLIADYKASPEFTGLAKATRALWAPPLDRIDKTFGKFSLATIEANGIRARFKAWHQSMSATPRTANVHLQVLIRLLQWGIDQERVTRNAAWRIKHIDEGAGRAHIVWSPAIWQAISAAGPPALQRNMVLLWESGLRREDFVQLDWCEVDLEAGHLRRPTNKSGGKRIAYPPITPAMARALEACPTRSGPVVTGEKGRPYKNGSAFYNTFKHVRDRAKVGPCPTLHDVRGTYVTFGYASGASDEDMELRMGWAPGSGAKMREIYGNREQLARAAAVRESEKFTPNGLQGKRAS